MYITKEAFNQHMDWAKYFRLGIRKRYAHEIAHQYWGIVVKMPSTEDQWITESFADYCAALYERDDKGPDLFEKVFGRMERKRERSLRRGAHPLGQ